MASEDGALILWVALPSDLFLTLFMVHCAEIITFLYNHFLF